MPTLANITIVDRATVPVSHVFKPVDLQKGIGYLEEDRADGSAVGKNLLQMSSTIQPSKRMKCVAKVSVPKVVVETINGVSVNKIVDVSFLTVIAEYGSQTTPADRDAILGMGGSICLPDSHQPILNKVMTGNERVYG